VILNKEQEQVEQMQILQALPVIDRKISASLDRLDQQVDGLIKANDFTGEVAMAFWHERRALQGLLRHFNTVAALHKGE
jgi:hypothetical protein